MAKELVLFADSVALTNGAFDPAGDREQETVDIGRPRDVEHDGNDDVAGRRPVRQLLQSAKDDRGLADATKAPRRSPFGRVEESFT
ncbi:hypothetical protein AB0I28_20030 [Phytomonospora sp. NPDC050363]|uniref:hypothetical protein n=1 Tax=Phytomonospora sp. NPDC050363 TaxID=3155642 RepID=UPI0033EDFC16